MRKRLIAVILVAISCLSLTFPAGGEEPPKITSWSNTKTKNEKPVFQVKQGEQITFSINAKGAEKYVWLVDEAVQEGANAASFKWTVPNKKGMWKICVKTTNEAQEQWAQKDAAVWKDRFKPRLGWKGKKLDFSEFVQAVIHLNVYPFESRKEWIVSTSLTKVEPGQSIQKAIDSLPPEGGIVEIAPGVHDVRETIRIKRSNVTIYGTRKSEIKVHDPVEWAFIISCEKPKTAYAVWKLSKLNLENFVFSKHNLKNFVFRGFKVTSTFTDRRGAVIRALNVDNVAVEEIENLSYLKCILLANPLGRGRATPHNRNMVIRNCIGHHSGFIISYSYSVYVVNNIFRDVRSRPWALMLDESCDNVHIVGNYAHRSGANASLAMDVGGPYNTRNNVFDGGGYSPWGIYFSSGVRDSIVINNTITRTKLAGIQARVQSRLHNVLIANNRIYNCKGSGIWMSELPHGRKQPNCNVDIVNNVIYNNNGDGIGTDSEHFSSVKVFNNIIANNKGYGINRLAGKITLGHNNVWNNAQGPYNGCAAGPGDISRDTLFADPTKVDFHLKSKAGRWDPKAKKWVKDNVDSPCIDAGDPKADWMREPAPNGGRVNMGAYGNTREASKAAIE